MTAAFDGLFASHLGIVVHDIEAAGGVYQRLLGVPRWYTREIDVQSMPWNPSTTEGRIRIAFGRTPGQTIELLQPLEGETFASIFLREQGEGVQHLGIWVPDLREAVRQAVDRGATLSQATLLRDGSGSVQLAAEHTPDEAIAAIDSGRPAFVDPGLGTMQIEFTGPSSIERSRSLTGDDFLKVFVLPPWAESGA